MGVFVFYTVRRIGRSVIDTKDAQNTVCVRGLQLPVPVVKNNNENNSSTGDSPALKRILILGGENKRPFISTLLLRCKLFQEQLLKVMAIYGKYGKAR